ncbi:MAG: DUF2939 domain-containing protein [Azonexus sp.]|jgi:hypothetical protein|nr:DUF2939 domain-containing protein [Azonexus sp.]
MTTALFCDQCGARLPTSSVKFCPSCGEALEQPPAAAPSGKLSFAPAANFTSEEESEIVDEWRAVPSGSSPLGRRVESAPHAASEAEAQASVAVAERSASRKVFAYVAASVVAAFCVWFYFTPHIAVNNMKSAAEARDAAKFSLYIDYTELRDSLKRVLTSKLVSETSGRNADPFAALGASMAAAFIDPAVDKLMTPEGLVMLMAGGMVPSAKRNNKAPGLKAEIDMAMAYESFNKFVVTIWEKDKKDDTVGLVFNRDGLFSWKLAAVRM